MQQVDGNPYRYTVETGEKVFLKVTPVGVGKFVTVNIDVVAQPKPNDLLYSFDVTKPTGQSHTVLMEFNFPGVNDPNARYDVAITAKKNGTPSGGPFSFSILQTDPDKEAAIKFKVT